MDPITNVTQVPDSPTRNQGVATVSDAVKSPGSDKAVKYDLGSEATNGVKSEVLDHKASSETEDDDSEKLKRVQNVVEEANAALASKHVSLNFWVDSKSDSVVVQVIESESGKVIRQIPPDEVLAMRNRLREMTGLIVDKEV